VERALTVERVADWVLLKEEKGELEKVVIGFHFHFKLFL
jgi:hypothetical protein